MINWLAKSKIGSLSKVPGLTGAYKRIPVRSTMISHTKSTSQQRRDATTEDKRPQIAGQMARTRGYSFTHR
jgi:hypothetical protein